MAEQRHLASLVGEAIGKGIVVGALTGIVARIFSDEKYLSIIQNPYVITLSSGYALGTLIELYRRNNE